MKAVINASPLIYLAKLERLDCLKLYKNIFTTDIVIKEIERGLEKGFQEALLIEKLVDEGFVAIKKVKTKKAEFGLHPGELSVIELAKKVKLKEIIVDDRSAIHVAKYFGLKVVSTPFLLLRNLKQENIDLDEFQDAMDRLIGFGYFISPNLYIKILKMAEKL